MIFELVYFLLPHLINHRSQEATDVADVLNDQFRVRGEGWETASFVLILDEWSHIFAPRRGSSTTVLCVCTHVNNTVSARRISGRVHVDVWDQKKCVRARSTICSVLFSWWPLASPQLVCVYCFVQASQHIPARKIRCNHHVDFRRHPVLGGL